MHCTFSKVVNPLANLKGPGGARKWCFSATRIRPNQKGRCSTVVQSGNFHSIFTLKYTICTGKCHSICLFYCHEIFRIQETFNILFTLGKYHSISIKKNHISNFFLSNWQSDWQVPIYSHIRLTSFYTINNTCTYSLSSRMPSCMVYFRSPRRRRQSWRVYRHTYSSGITMKKSTSWDS